MNFKGTVINEKYRILEKIGEGGLSTVWLGENLSDDRMVAIKILKKDVASDRIEDLIRFRNEANTVTKLNIPEVVKIFEVGETDGLHYIIMEHLKGKSLHEMLADGKKFTIAELNEIIYKICEGLRSIHKARVIFRDLKPGNIIIEDENKISIKLIDLGLSQMREYDISDENQIAGTLYYMAPEQSGVFRRIVDERADLYSVGVIYYQLLTEKLPFYGDSINSIIHQHAAKVPEAPSKYNPNIPGIVERIVLKLLEKEPEKRYQSAEGLMKDIEKVLKGESDFLLSSDDELFKLNYRTSLVGRDEEYFSLMQMYEQASNGSGGLCFLSGEAGKGKTRLAEELKGYCIKSGGIFIDGKCFAGENKMPYGVFKDSINVYLKDYSKFNSEKKEEIKKRVKEFIGDLGRVLLKFNPITAEIVGQCPELVELEPESENNRFKMIVCQFIYALGELNKPLVILLDDLQWVDEGSIGIMNEISDKISDFPILIIGTFRDNEVGESHILQKYLKNGNESGFPIKHIILKSFDIGKMFIFVSMLLFEKGKDIWNIAEFIQKKSGGNPFFALEILKHMISEKAVVRFENKWFIENEVLNTIQISSSIVEILIKRISSLTEKEKQVVSKASVIGRKFDINFLFKLIDLENEEVLEIVDKALEMQFLEQTGDEKGELRFVHDRIREVFYRSMVEDDRRKAHLKIACLLEEYNKNESDKFVFELTYHYFEGKDMKKAVEYSYPSGKKAKSSYAYEDAYKYFQMTRNILSSIPSKEELRRECTINLAEVASYTSRNDEAIALLDSILPGVKSNIEKAEVYRLNSLAHYNMGEFEASYRYGSKGLSLLGEHFPEGKLNVILSIVKELFLRQIYNYTNKSVYSKKIKYENSENYVKIHTIFQTLNNMSAYYSIIRFVYGIIRGFNLVETKIGWSLDLGYGIGGYGGFMAASDRFEAAVKFFETSVNIFTELNNPIGIAQEYQFLGITYEFMGNYTKSAELLKKSMVILKKLGEIKGSNFSLNALIRQYYYIGDLESMNNYLEQYEGFYNKTKDSYLKNSASVYRSQYYRERGKHEKSLECGNYMLDREFEIKDLNNYCLLCISFGLTYLEMGDSENALFYLEKAKEINEKNSFFKQHVVLLYPHLVESHILNYNEMKGKVPVKDERQKLKKIREIMGIAMKKTRKFPTHIGATLRVAAQFQLLSGNITKAEALFRKSIEHCKAYNRKYELGKSLFEYGLHLYSVLKKKESQQCIQDALDVFKQLDSKCYLRLCEKFLGINNIETAVQSDKLAHNIRASQQMSSINSLSQKISSILNLEILLDNIMQMTQEITGAQNGYLFLLDDKTGEMKQVVSKLSHDNKDMENGISENIIKKVREKGEAIITSNALEDVNYLNYESVVLNNIKSVLCYPIKYNDELIGICYLDNKITSSVFTEDDLNILSIFMTQAAISIENAKLYKMAITDGLTELITHKHFMSLLEIEVQRAKRYDRGFSLVIFDIDNFKAINDIYGHQAGDEVLARVAVKSKQISRKSDIVARYGGDEFAVIIPETGMNNADVFAEKLRSAVESMTVKYKDVDIKVTISLGVAEFNDFKKEGVELINNADSAMYMSKQNGRNRVTFYTNSMEAKN